MIGVGVELVLKMIVSKLSFKNADNIVQNLSRLECNLQIFGTNSVVESKQESVEFLQTPQLQAQQLSVSNFMKFYRNQLIQFSKLIQTPDHPSYKPKQAYVNCFLISKLQNSNEKGSSHRNCPNGVAGTTIPNKVLNHNLKKSL